MPATPPWYVISLRPRGDHAALRRAAARHGGGVIALSPWRLQQCDDAATRSALRLALAAPRVVFTSPPAVRAARALQAFAPRREQAWCAVGAGTAAALRRAGVHEVQAPTRMDSEGLLALPALQDVAGRDVGLVTAPGGRGEITPALLARGARVLRADVYAREPVPLSAQRAATAARRRCAAGAGVEQRRGAAARARGVAAPNWRRNCAARRWSPPASACARWRSDTASRRSRPAGGPRPADLLAAAARRLPVA